MSKRNNVVNIIRLFESECAKLDEDTIYQNRHSILNYRCRYGENHTTTLAQWQRGRRCSCFKKWENRLNGFNKAKAIIEINGGKILFTLDDFKTYSTPLYFVNKNNKKVKMSLSNLKLCEKIQHLKDDIILYYTEDKKLKDVIVYFKQPIISMALRLWGKNNSDSNRFIRVDIDKDILYTKYWEEQRHPSMIAEELNCSKCVVLSNMHKYNIPFRTKSEARLGELNPIYSVGHSEETRKKMSQAFVNGRKIGYHTNWGKTSRYSTPNQGIVTMRSMWEVRVADYLTEMGKDWFYEYKTFKLTDTISYRPDFYIPEDALYIEVKGRLLDADLLKLELFESLGFTVLLWDRDKLRSIGLINSSGKIVY